MSHRFIKGLRYVTFAEWAWVWAKLATGILAPVSVFFSTPSAVAAGLVQMSTFHLVMALMAAGGVLCATGLLLRATRVQPLIVGYAIEMAGLIPLFSAPLILSFMYAIIYFTRGGPTITGAAFCLALASLIFARFADILTLRLATKEPEERGHFRTGS